MRLRPHLLERHLLRLQYRRLHPCNWMMNARHVARFYSSAGEAMVTHDFDEEACVGPRQHHQKRRLRRSNFQSVAWRRTDGRNCITPPTTLRRHKGVGTSHTDDRWPGRVARAASALDFEHSRTPCPWDLTPYKCGGFVSGLGHVGWVV